MVEIQLHDGQSGYDVVEGYAQRFWEHHIPGECVVRIGRSYDGVKYYVTNEVILPNDGFLYDWWESETYIRIYGLLSVDELDITGGIYEE